MSAEILGSTVVHNVRPVLQRTLEIRAHHGVVCNDDCVGGPLLDLLADGGEVCDFQERVGG